MGQERPQPGYARDRALERHTGQRGRRHAFDLPAPRITAREGILLLDYARCKPCARYR
jgi:hypothetical protein